MRDVHPKPIRRLLFLFLLGAAAFSCGGDEEVANDDARPWGGFPEDDSRDPRPGDGEAADDDAGPDEPLDLGGLIPGPGEPGYDAELHQKALRYGQQFQGLMAYPFGMSLEAYIPDEAMRALVEDWLTNSDVTEGFEEYTGLPVYQVMRAYGEFGDLGMFGGVASLGDLFRYALVRDFGAEDPVPIEELRGNVLRLLDALHACTAITGHHGGFVRGLRLRGLPGEDPETTPLFDEDGNPLPPVKADTWRADNSPGGEFPDYIWLDNTSKDQLDGFVLSMGAAWDVIADDPEFPEEVKARLQADAAALGDHLMTVAPETGLDLTIRDADGRLVGFHDLNAREFEGVILPAGFGNGFNAIMALGIVKTIAFITRDPKYQAFYEELLYERDYLRYVDQTFWVTNVGPLTNWSNVNMAYCAMYPLLRYEVDGTLRKHYWRVLVRDVWDGVFANWGVSRVNQAYFNVIQAAFAEGAPDAQVADLAAEDLSGFPDPPSWNLPRIVNCDEEEIAAGVCLAADGETVIHIAGFTLGDRFVFFPGHTGDPQATDPLPRTIRPPSNFNWRSSPYQLNGGGGDRLNPGGDFHGAYWLGRYLRRSDDSAINVSPRAW